MKLTSSQGEFELNILDYEYGDSPDFLERNWLLVSLRTRIDGHEHQRMAPVLSTWEIEMLRDWMCSITEQGPGSAKLTFIEPALTFRADTLGRGDYRFQIHLNQDVSSTPTDRSVPNCLTVSADVGQVKVAISDLEQQLNRFPVRN